MVNGQVLNGWPKQSIFAERISFIVKRNGNAFEFLQKKPLGIGQKDDYYLWTDLNSDATLQENELTRPSVLNDIFTSRVNELGQSLSFRTRRSNFVEVNMYGDVVGEMTVLEDQPWSFFEYHSQPCLENTGEGDETQSEVSP